MIDGAALRRDGHVSVTLLSEAQVDELAALAGQLEPIRTWDFFASGNDLDRADARRVHDAILAVVAAPLAQLLPDHRPFLASFLSKAAHSPTTVEFHQDLTYTDERTHRSLVVWIPLDDVDEDAGAMQVVPGSHRLVDGMRPGGAEPLPTAALHDELSTRASTVALRAGDALLYDPALVHGSPPNTGDRPRIAVGVALAPADASLVHAHLVDGELQVFEVDEAYHLDQGVRTLPDGYPRREPWTAAVTTDDLSVALGVHPDTCAAPRASADTDRAMVLRDADADRALATDGVVVIDLDLPDEVLHVLRDAYGELHGWQGTDFEADLTNADRTYRRAVSDTISAQLDDVVTERFVGHTPFLRVFLCKWPGPHSDLYLHRDWMYVDERGGGRTFVVWIPLDDVDERDGALQVLRGSHRLDPSLRGTNLNAPWIQQDEVVRARLDTVTVRRGSAVVLDNAVVHSSLPNLGGHPRLVAAVGLRPANEPLVHFLRDGDAAVRYDVDDQFFLDTTPQELMGHRPDLPVAELVDGAQRTPSPEELAQALDRRSTIPSSVPAAAHLDDGAAEPEQPADQAPSAEPTSAEARPTSLSAASDAPRVRTTVSDDAVSVLVVTAYPDERRSTVALREIVARLEREGTARVTVWFLRCTDHQVPWPGSRVIDRLRTWAPAAALSGIGAERAAGMLRGARLRRWMATVDPDVVVLDDGLGERVLAHCPRTALRVVRLNADEPADRAMEPPAPATADLLLVDVEHRGPEPDATIRMIQSPHLSHRPAVRGLVRPGARAAQRSALGLDPDPPLVVGWGDDGWLDGPDVFIRVLWAVVQQGLDVNALWLGLDEDRHEADRLRAEAQRCGVGDRFHLRPSGGAAQRLCGDVVLLSDRSPGRPVEPVIEAIVAGTGVVAFDTAGIDDEAVVQVPTLDVVAAAAAVVEALEHTDEAARHERRDAAARRLDVCGRIGELRDAER